MSLPVDSSADLHVLLLLIFLLLEVLLAFAVVSGFLFRLLLLLRLSSLNDLFLFLLGRLAGDGLRTMLQECHSEDDEYQAEPPTCLGD